MGFFPLGSVRGISVLFWSIFWGFGLCHLDRTLYNIGAYKEQFNEKGSVRLPKIWLALVITGFHSLNREKSEKGTLWRKLSSSITMKTVGDCVICRKCGKNKTSNKIDKIQTCQNLYLFLQVMEFSSKKVEKGQ